MRRGKSEEVHFCQHYSNLFNLRFSINIPRRGGTAINFWAYVLIFSTWSWCVIASIYLFTTIAFVCITNFLVDTNDGYEKDVGSWTVLGSVGAIFLQRDSEGGMLLRSLTISSQILHLTVSLCAVIVFAFYSGVLTSLMTARPLPPPITSFSDVKDLGLDLLVMESSSDETFLIQSKPGTALYDIYYGTMVGDPNHLYPNYDGIVRRMKSDPDTAHFGSDIAALMDDAIVSLPLGDAFKSPTAFAYPKNSEFFELFNHVLHNMEERGTMDRIRRKWLPDGNQGASGQSLADASELDYFNLIFPYLTLISGILMGLVTVGVEAMVSCVTKIKISV